MAAPSLRRHRWLCCTMPRKIDPKNCTLPPQKQASVQILTRLSRGATSMSDAVISQVLHFYSHASREARLSYGTLSDPQNDFYSHASREARPLRCVTAGGTGKFLLTRLSRGATGLGANPQTPADFYSHASREARLIFLLSGLRRTDFYSHASREARLLNLLKDGKKVNFYSHASREARPLRIFFTIGNDNFYSHASREARRNNKVHTNGEYLISTHTPLARRDCIIVPVGVLPVISTHTPLARRDPQAPKHRINITDFYSHASREARPEKYGFWCYLRDFYSHASREARPLPPLYNFQIVNISTHTPLARRDSRYMGT